MTSTSKTDLHCTNRSTAISGQSYFCGCGAFVTPVTKPFVFMISETQWVALELHEPHRMTLVDWRGNSLRPMPERKWTWLFLILRNVSFRNYLKGWYMSRYEPANNKPVSLHHLQAFEDDEYVETSYRSTEFTAVTTSLGTGLTHSFRWHILTWLFWQ